jgi:hypothetical protein
MTHEHAREERATMSQDDVAKKMGEASDQPVSGASSSSGQGSSAEKARSVPETMSEASDDQGASSDKPSPGFKDPLPPGTDSKSGPGSDGPV